MSPRRPIPTAVGLACLAAAAFWSNTGIESAFGRGPGSLSWGPTLFRALLGVHGALLLALGHRSSESEPASGIPGAVTPRWAWWSLSVMCAVAAALRLWRLDTGLWLDEIFTLVGFVRLPASEIVTRFPDQNQHMLFSLMAHASVRIFGEHAWSLRLPSVLFGVASVWALFLLGRRLLGARAALFACGLMTVSYHHIWFSQNARGYMGLLFFSVLSVWIWFEALERRRLGWWVAFGASTALGVWSHMTMVFVAAGIGVIYLAGLLRRNSLERRAGWGPVLAMTLAATLSLQLHALTVPEFLRTAVGEVSMPSEWTNPMWVVTESLRSLNIGLAGTGVLLLGATFLVFGWIRLAMRNPRAILVMTLAPVMGGALMLAASHNLWPRFFFFAMGFVLLMVIGGIGDLAGLASSMFNKPTWRPRLELAACAVLIGASLLTVPRVYRLPKQDFEGARQYAEALRRPGSAVVAVGLAGMAYEKYYAPDWEVARTAGELENLSRNDAGLTLVYTLPIELKGFHPDVWRVIEERFTPVRAFPGTLGGGEIYVCRQKANGESRVPASFRR